MGSAGVSNTVGRSMLSRKACGRQNTTKGGNEIKPREGCSPSLSAPCWHAHQLGDHGIGYAVQPHPHSHGRNKQQHLGLQRGQRHQAWAWADATHTFRTGNNEEEGKGAQWGTSIRMDGRTP